MPVAATLYVLCAAAAIVSRQRRWRFASPLKGLPVACLAAMMAVGFLAAGPEARGGPQVLAYLAVACGLVCGLAGDLFLLDKARHLKKGALAFLVGHLWYIAAFALSGLAFAPGALALALAYFALYAYILFGRLLARHPNYRLIALAYLASLAGMAVLAGLADAYRATLGLRSTFFAGAMLFSVSDGVLSYRMFGRHFRLADLAVLSTYYAAQGLIAYGAWAALCTSLP